MRSINGKIIAVIAIAAIGIVLWLQFRTPEISNTKPPVLVQVATVVRKNMPLELRNVGNVVPYESVTVRSRLDSQLMQVTFRDGDNVQQGDLLFVLDDRALKAQLNQLQANLERDRAQLANLNQQYQRNRQLAGKGFESAANLDDSKAAYEAQKAIVRATEAEIENVKVQLAYTNITAPISGRTGTINITVGNTVKANDTNALVTINQIVPIRVQLSLPQQYLQTVRTAMAKGPLKVLALKEDGSTLSEGTLEYIDNTVDPSTGTFATRAIFANADEKLWPGMFVSLLVGLEDEKDVLTIPEVAVQHGQKDDFVFVIKDNTASKRPIKVSRLLNGTAVILEGLQEGEQVAVDGLLSLREGSAVSTSEAK